MKKAAKDTKLHIVYLVAFIADISGGPRVIVEHANNLIVRGHDVEIWTSEEGMTPYFECKAPVKKVDMSELNKPDIAVMTDIGWLPAVAERRGDKKSFLLVQHDWEWVSDVMQASVPTHIFHEYKDYFTSGRCTILSVSTWVQQVLMSRYGLDSVLIPNAVDPAIFHKAEPLVAPDVPTVLMLFDSQIWKGFVDAIQALDIVKQKIPNLRLLIIGRFFPEVPLEPGASYGFPFPALYFNRPNQPDLARIYTSASVFVSASWLEGFGLPGLEAMACGTPVVTTDSGGVRDYATPDETAVVVTPQDSKAIASGILRVLEDEELRDRLVQKGLQKAKQFTWKTSIDKLEENFRKAMLPVIS